MPHYHSSGISHIYSSFNISLLNYFFFFLASSSIRPPPPHSLDSSGKTKAGGVDIVTVFQTCGTKHKKVFDHILESHHHILYWNHINCMYNFCSRNGSVSLSVHHFGWIFLYSQNGEHGKHYYIIISI